MTNAAPTVALLEDAGINTIIQSNPGIKTKNWGSSAVASGQTTIDVNHGLFAAPPLGTINVTPTNSLGLAMKMWVSAVDATKFTVSVDLNPGAATASFSWSASCNN